MQREPIEPNFIKNITAVQRLFAGVAVSMFLMVWLTGFDFIRDIFKPDFVVFLSYLRVGIASAAILLTCLVGYQQAKRMLDWLVENYEIYKQITDAKKGKKD